MLHRLFCDRGIGQFSDTCQSLSDMVANFGFRFLAMAVAGPEATCYDPLLMRNWRMRAPDAEVVARAQSQLFEYISSNPFQDEFPEEIPGGERIVAMENAAKGKAVSVKNLRELLLLFRELEVHRVILLAEKKPTVTGLSLAALGIAVEWHPKSILALPDHDLVPPHRRLSNKEAAAIRKKVPGISAQMRTDDTAARYFGFPVGCMVEILHTVESVGEMPEYRIVR